MCGGTTQRLSSVCGGTIQRISSVCGGHVMQGETGWCVNVIRTSCKPHTTFMHTGSKCEVEMEV